MRRHARGTAEEPEGLSIASDPISACIGPTCAGGRASELGPETTTKGGSKGGSKGAPKAGLRREPLSVEGRSARR